MLTTQQRDFNDMIDKWLCNAPVVPGFREFFIQHLQNVFVKYLDQVHKKSKEVYKGEGRRIALPEDIFKAIKILKFEYINEDIQIFFEYYKKLTEVVKPDQRELEVRALYEHYLKYKEASEYIDQSAHTGVARNEHMSSAAEARKKWKQEFIKDVFLQFPPVESTTEFKDIEEQRRINSEETVDLLNYHIRKSMNRIKQVVCIDLQPKVPSFTEFQEYFVKSIKDFVKRIYAKSQAMQGPEITVEQQKLIGEACDRMIEDMNFKDAEWGFSTLHKAVANLSNEDMQTSVGSISVADQFFDTSLTHMTKHIDQNLKRKRLDIDLNATQLAVDLNALPEEAQHSDEGPSLKKFDMNASPEAEEPDTDHA